MVTFEWRLPSGARTVPPRYLQETLALGRPLEVPLGPSKCTLWSTHLDSGLTPLDSKRFSRLCQAEALLVQQSHDMMLQHLEHIGAACV